MVYRPMESERKDELLNVLSAASIAMAALFLILLFKVKGGLLGLVLGAVAVATLFYWLREIRSLFREESAYPKDEAEFFYDLLDDGEALIFVAKVPGPAEEVEAKLEQGFLEIRGGGNFFRAVKVSKEVELQTKSYINGVLHVKLQKIRRISKDDTGIAQSGPKDNRLQTRPKY